MKRGLDTNILIYAHIPAFEIHGRVRRFLLDQLQTPEITLAVTPSILHEFIHVVTDPRRFEAPLTMGEAAAVARLYLGKANIDCLAADSDVFLDALVLLERHGLGRKRIADTLFAATLLQHGVREVITCNPRDFAAFEDLRTIDPTVESKL